MEINQIMLKEIKEKYNSMLISENQLKENKKTAGKYYSIFINDIVPKTNIIKNNIKIKSGTKFYESK